MKDTPHLRRLIKAGRLVVMVILAGLVIVSCKKLDFTKTEPLPQDVWLHYDDGINYTSVYCNYGGSFDIAMRFSPSDLTKYDGYEISKIKFYPTEGYPTVYYITLWEGSEPPTLLHAQQVSVIADTWNEAGLSQYFEVDASTDLWVGVWITSYPTDTYPAGCDEGPADAGKGDLYSADNGLTWYSLSTVNTDLNYNWNLQVMLSSPGGEKVTLAPSGNENGKEDKLEMKAVLPDNPAAKMNSSELKERRP